MPSSWRVATRKTLETLGTIGNQALEIRLVSRYIFSRLNGYGGRGAAETSWDSWKSCHFMPFNVICPWTAAGWEASCRSEVMVRKGCRGWQEAGRQLGQNDHNATAQMVDGPVRFGKKGRPQPVIELGPPFCGLPSGAPAGVGTRGRFTDLRRRSSGEDAGRGHQPSVDPRSIRGRWPAIRFIPATSALDRRSMRWRSWPTRGRRPRR